MDFGLVAAGLDRFGDADRRKIVPQIERSAG
jgi:hypothetical protein